MKYSKTYILTLSGDGMVNLDKQDMSFRSSGLDQWSTQVDRSDLVKFLLANELTLGVDSVVQSRAGSEFDGEVWGFIS